MEQYLNTDADLVIQGYEEKDSKGSILKRKILNNQRGDTRDSIHDILKNVFVYSMFFGPLWNKMFRSEIIKQYNLQFDESINIREDELFMYQYCSHIKSVHVLSTFSYNYIVRDNSLMHNRKWKHPQSMIDIVKKCQEASMDLKPNVLFQKELNSYFCDTLAVTVGHMYENRRHLLPMKERWQVLEEVLQFNVLYNKNNISKALTRNCFRYVMVTDIIHFGHMWFKYFFNRIVRNVQNKE